jgi:hypothetical protein
MAKTEGRKIVLLTALLLHILALVLLIIAFITPYWVISWPRVYSGFRKIGMWEVCFAGYRIPNDPAMKSYHGCWWIIAPELYQIRSWIMPPWFIIVQILMTISVVIEILSLIFLLMIWSTTSSRDNSGIGKRRAPFNLVQGATIITIITCCVKAVAVIMFGLAFKYDPFWLPNHEINYPHVSYGLAICSTFISIFSSMAHRVYRNIVRREYLQPSAKDQSSFPMASLYNTSKDSSSSVI